MVRLNCARQHALAQPLDQHARHVAAAVGAVVDDQALFANLRVIPLDEFADAVGAHVRHVDIADAAARQFVHPAAVGRHPIEVHQLLLIGDGTVSDGAGALRWMAWS